MVGGTNSFSHAIKKRFFLLPVLLSIFSYRLASQPPLFKVPAYVNNYSEQAISEMAMHKIPASVILAQAIFESNCGTSQLASRSNNHFGIKCHTQWRGDTIVKNDDTLNECFRKYQSVEDSYADHSLFLRSRARYAGLFKLSPRDYKGWCYGLKACGYATFQRYSEQLIKIIEDFELYEFDGAEKMVSGKIFIEKIEEIKTSGLSIEHFSAQEILQTDALFIDEKEVILQSFELVAQDDDDDLAGNP
jgi:hypothetical protein